MTITSKFLLLCPHQAQRKLLFILLWLCSLLSGIAMQTPYATQESAKTFSSLPKVTKQIILAKIKEVETSDELDDSMVAQLIELYRKTLSHLEAKSSYDETARNYMHARKTADKEAKNLRKKIQKVIARPPAAALRINEKSLLPEIEQQLLTEKANQAAVEAKLADIEQQLNLQQDRPETVQQRLIDAKRSQEEISSALSLPPSAEEIPKLQEARYWLKESQALALQAEIKMLDQELLSLPMRLDLLKAKREYLHINIERIRTRVQLLQELVNKKRRVEAEQTITEAEEAQREVKGKHPLIEQLAQENARLSEEIKVLTADLDRISASDANMELESKRITEEFNRTRQKLKLAGLDQAFGQMLLEQRRSLPDFRALQQQAESRKQLLSESGLRQIRYQEQLRKLHSSTYIDRLTAGLTADENKAIHADLVDLIAKRRALLQKANDLNEKYFRALGGLDFAQRKLIETAAAYDQFLTERLLWIPTSPPPGFATLQEIPGQLAQFLSPVQWADSGWILFLDVIHSPFLLVTLTLLAVILRQADRLRQMLQYTGNEIIKLRTDRFLYTIIALVITLLLAAPWPLLLAAVGWQLHQATAGNALSLAVASGLLWIWKPFFFLQTFYFLSIPGGIAAAHFHWPECTLQRLRGDLRKFMISFLPLAFFAVTVINYDIKTLGGGLGRLLISATQLFLAFFFYRQFTAGNSALQEFIKAYPDSILVRFRILWFIITVVLAVVLAGITFAGYVYTGGTLTARLLDSLWFILGLVILQQLLFRWLLLTRRRLAFQAELKRREEERAELIARQTEHSEEDVSTLQVEEPKIDLVSLSDDSCKLLNTAIAILGAVGLWMIWADLLPALSILDTVTLWHSTEIIAGEASAQPVTLKDLCIAIFVAAITILAAKRLPSLLEIILLQRLSLTAGDRYTIKTLSNYFIVGLGIILFFNALGGSWTQIKWLFAALGVGIGFGLQEIVANFISGLIILFERPIRVGDVVTVGDTDGIVTRIQIRATTIRNWDKKELLVPNKEFITGRLLNWSLSDQITRIRIPVGIAYGSDVQQAKALMLEAAENNDCVLSDPGPFVIFEEFGDNALLLVLRCYLASLDYRLSTIGRLHEDINQMFNDHGIVIAFPQRDMHLDTSQPLAVQIHGIDRGAGNGSGK